MTPKQFVLDFNRLGSMRKVWKAHTLTWHEIRSIKAKAVAEGLMDPLVRHGPGRKSNEEKIGKVHALQTPVSPVPVAGVKRYLLTCAQNDTGLHEGFWNNLLALRDYWDAELHVARFAYAKRGFGEVGDKAAFGQSGQRTQDMSWDARITPYLSDGRLELAPGLVWCGEMNILPTAVTPLSGLEVYTGRRSAIFPHVKIAMQSVASNRNDPTKFNYTTGTVTLRNYIQRKAGLKAEFHHCYGALLVEVDADGNWFCRQLNADSDGTFYDLDLKVERGVVSVNHHVEAITWGDIHVAEQEPWVLDLAFRKDGMLDELQPKAQFLHDVLHFRGRSHHEIKNPHAMFRRHCQGVTDVRKECLDVVAFLAGWAGRPWCQSYVVDSNHHHHLGRWLAEQNGLYDSGNAKFWIAIQKRVYDAIAGDQQVNYLSLVFDELGYTPSIDRVRMLGEDESLVICPDAHGGIECGAHGDYGPNGSRGSAQNLSKMGRRANIGHSHSACIVDGVYQTGTCGTLRPDWTHGPSSWSHSHIVTYQNGKRAIVTMWNGKWRAA